MNYPMQYPEAPDFNKLREQLVSYAQLKYEAGASEEFIQQILDLAGKTLQDCLDTLRKLPEDEALRDNEPDHLDQIRLLRPKGEHALWQTFDRKDYMDQLKGALIGRFAGCTLGAPVEFWTVEAMREWAEYCGDAFPPEDYWSAAKNPSDLRYGMSKCQTYTRSGIKGVPVDDDVTYTLLGLLILEDSGIHFTVNEVGKAWLKYLPYACTAEEIALDNLRKNISAEKAAEHQNPYVQWIGADIRSDPWGYVAPGLPEKAAELAWRDAFISHRRNGLYGAMYFSAVIAAAFATRNVKQALEKGLAEIPLDCLLARDLRWALDIADTVLNYEDARQAVQKRFGGMSGVHTNLNACLTVFGLLIGGDDFTKVIGEIVAMSYDNDCTAATAGSIFGAAYGLSAIPEKWYRSFENTVYTYMNDQHEFKIDDVVSRFADQAEAIFASL